MKGTCEQIPFHFFLKFMMLAMAGVPFGTQLLINGNVYTVEDLGTPYGHVDIYFNSHSEALAFGLQSAEVYRLN